MPAPIRITVELDADVADALERWAKQEERPPGNAAALALKSFLRAQGSYQGALDLRYRTVSDNGGPG